MCITLEEHFRCVTSENQKIQNFFTFVLGVLVFLVIRSMKASILGHFFGVIAQSHTMTQNSTRMFFLYRRLYNTVEESQCFARRLPREHIVCHL